MTNIFKKSGQKIVKRATRFSRRASENSKEHIRENLIDRISHIHDIRLLIVEWGLLVSVVIILSLVQSAWYTESYSISSFKTGGTYVEGTLGPVNSLNPLYASTNSEKSLARLLFSSLAENDYTGHIAPALASSISHDPEGQSWIVELREGLKWSDGEPLTNEDVIFTVNLIKNPNTSTIYSQCLSGVSVSETEDKKLFFELPTAYADFDYVLDFPILPKHILADVEPALILESDFSKKPVSSGAFSYKATQTVTSSEGETITYLSPNEYYYKGKPYLNSFAIHAYLDKDSIVSALNSGSITATAELSSKDSEKISTDSIIELKTTINSGAFAFFNTKSSLLSDKNIRKTIKNSVDFDAIRSSINAMSALDYPIFYNQVEGISWPEDSTHDIASARRAVKEIGEEVLKTPLSIVTVNDGELPEVANLFKTQLEEIGFTANVTVYDYSQEFISNIINTRSYDIFIYEVELGAVPELFSYYHSSQTGSSGLNFSNYENSLVDDLILASRETMDESLRTAKYESFLKNWNEDAPSVALYQSTTSYFYNKNTRTFSENTNLAVPTDRFVDVRSWATEKTSLNRTP